MRAAQQPAAATEHPAGDSDDPAAGGRMARLVAAPRGGLADNSAVHSRSSDG